MASFQHQLISKIIQTGDLAAALNWGITAEDFMASEPKLLWLELLSIHNSRDSNGAIPGVNTIGELFPTFVFVHDDGMTIEALCVLVRRNRLVSEASLVGDDLTAATKEPPTAVISRAIEKLTQLQELGEARSCDVPFSKAIQQISIEYEKASTSEGHLLSDIPWPWPDLNSISGGILHDDTIILYGRPKSFKSWVLAYMVSFLIEAGHPILLYTKEMSPVNLFRRVAACMARVPYQEFRTGQLQESDWNAFKGVYEYVVDYMHSNAAVCLAGQDVAEGGDTIPWLRSKIEKYGPKVVVVDGLYLMSASRQYKKTNERVEDISRGARQMVLGTGVPLIATAQANRKAAGHQNAELDEIAHSDAIGQDATVAARTIYDKRTGTVVLGVAGSREWSIDGIRINAKPAYDFTFHSFVDSRELEQVAERDENEDEEKRITRPRLGKQHPAAKVNGKTPATGNVARAAVLSYQQRQVTR